MAQLCWSTAVDDRSSSRKTPKAEETFERDTRSIGEAVVSEYLWWRGLDHVDYVLATHADADHMDGLNDVMRNFEVRAALVARRPAGDRESVEFAAAADKKSIPLVLIGAGDSLDFGAVRVAVLWPPASNNVQARSSNNDSLVLQIEYGKRRILMLADIENKAELALSREAGETLPADVVKVAHHGSRTSSTAGFVAAVRAKVAVISVGQQSMFGHPHREVVERWRAAGAEILTTGQSGTITVTTDGVGLEVTTFVKQVNDDCRLPIANCQCDSRIWHQSLLDQSATAIGNRMKSPIANAQAHRLPPGGTDFIRVRPTRPIGNCQSAIGNSKSQARKIVGCVEIDLGTADFVSLEHAEWRRVDVNRDQILATDVRISQLMNVGNSSIGNFAGAVLAT